MDALSRKREVGGNVTYGTGPLACLSIMLSQIQEALGPRFESLLGISILITLS